MDSNLYYTAPRDEVFNEMKKACTEVWGEYADSPGGYMKGKVDRIRDIANVQDNFMYMLAMFDTGNQAKVICLLSQETKNEVKKRLIAGGNDIYYLNLIGL